jgi:hypothetical protein
MRRHEEGARVRFTDASMEKTNSTPLFGYWWGTVLGSLGGLRVQVKWDADGAITEVSDYRKLTTRKTGKYAKGDGYGTR